MSRSLKIISELNCLFPTFALGRGLFLSFFIALLFTPGIVWGEVEDPLPLCPASLRSDTPGFREIRRTCDFNRKRLPPCPVGQPSIDPYQLDWLNQPMLHARRRECAKEWTVIAFLAMNNDLNDFGEDDLGELAWGKALDREHRVDVLVEAAFRDRPGKRYVFEANLDSGRPSDVVVKDFRGIEHNTGDPKTLENYLEWAVEEFPARNYMIVIGGHGDGWAATVPKPAAAPNASSGRLGNGLARDDTFNDWLTIPDLKHVLTRVSNTYLGGSVFDVFAADACFMQQAEVAFELRNHANFIYGSIPVMAYQGLPYTELIRGFVEGKYDSPRTLAIDLPKLMLASYKDKNDRVYASTIDATVLREEFADSLLELGRAGSAWFEASADKIMDSFQMTSIISDTIQHQNSVVEFRDLLGKWEASLAAEEPRTAPLKTAIQKMRTTLERTMISHAYGDRYLPLRDRILGLSIWFPSSMASFRNFEEELSSSRLHSIDCKCSFGHLEPNAWGLFLRNIFTLKP